MRISGRAVTCLGVLAISGFLSGCGGGPAKLSLVPAKGKVVYSDGSPLTQGNVEFQPVEEGTAHTKPSARGAVQPDGTFVLETYEKGDGAPIGKHRALVVTLDPEADMPGDPVPPPLIDKKFRSFDTSGLQFEVTEAGPNDFTLTVEKPK